MVILNGLIEEKRKLDSELLVISSTYPSESLENVIDIKNRAIIPTLLPKPTIGDTGSAMSVCYNFFSLLAYLLLPL